VALAADVQTVPEMLGPLTTRDRGALVRAWSLGFLRLSKDPADHGRSPTSRRHSGRSGCR
jgi:hypothetical protein